MTNTTTIFRAARILTMNADQPVATHVAVRGGRVVGVGSLDELGALGPADLDDRFADKVLLPGFLEGHTHADAGSIWDYAYCGFFERVDADGRVWSPCHTLDAAIDRLRQVASRQGGDDIVIGWGFDPILLGVAFTRADLDRVSGTRPVAVVHLSGHVLYLNTVALQRAKLFPPRAANDGIPLGNDGLPIGEIKGVECLLPAAHALDLMRVVQCTTVEGLQAFARLCVRAGITTATDLANLMTPDTLDVLQRTTAASDFPVRIVAALLATGATPAENVARALHLRSLSTDRLRLGMIKLVVDGSIQAFTARIRDPGYHNGAPNGLWYMAPEHVQEYLQRGLDAGLPVHVHTNGDQASELVLGCLANVLRQRAPCDHRTTLQHAQLMDEEQLGRLGAMGGCVNLFVNHLYYWGDVHAQHTVGPARAARMNAAASALRARVPLGLHSDDPVTAMSPLFTAWCAVNRLTSTGRQFAPDECISVTHSLHAMTLGTAYTLHLDHEVGSIETGKRADFAVLEDDPTRVDPRALKDVQVWGTMFNGQPVQAHK